MIALPLARKIAELFLILFSFAAMVKIGVLKSQDSRVLSRVSLYFVTPCVVFNSFLKEMGPEVRQGLVASIIFALVIHLVYFLIARALVKVWKATEVERASIVFTNAGNLVIPLVAYTLGDAWVIYVSGYILIFNMLFWTVGLRIFDSEGGRSLRKVLLNPNMLAILAGILVMLTGVKLPETLSIAFSDVAAMIGPLSMMIIGMVTGGMKLRELTANRRIWGVLLFRMVISSGIAVLLAVLVAKAGWVSNGKQLLMIPLLSAIAPSASNIPQMAILYDHDAKYASAINIVTTLSCILTVPLWIALYQAAVG